MVDNEWQPLINHYARNKYWNHVQTICGDVIRKRGTDPIVVFWKAFATSMQGDYSEAIRELEVIIARKEVALAVVACLLSTHKQCTVKDEESISSLKIKLKEVTKTSGPASMLLAASYFWHADKITHAKRCIDKVLSHDSENVQALALLGWIELSEIQASGRIRKPKSAKSPIFFDQFDSSNTHIELILGRAKWLEMTRQYSASLDILNTVISRFTWFIPAATEKARLMLMLGEWEHANDAATRILQSDPSNIDALFIVILFMLTHESKQVKAASRIEDLRNALDQTEPRNASLYLHTATCFFRLSGFESTIMEQTRRCLDTAINLDPSNCLIITEIGHHFFHSNDYVNALEYYTRASDIDDAHASAPYGIVRCKMRLGQHEEAKQKLEFLNEIQAQVSDEADADLLELNAYMAWQLLQDEKTAVELIDQAVDAHLEKLRAIPLSVSFFETFNYNFQIQIVKLLMQFVGTEPMQATDPVNRVLTSALKLLNQIVEILPGRLEAQLLLAQACFLNNQFEKVDRAINTCISLDPSCAEVYVLRAQKYMQQEAFRQVPSMLQQALSLKFEMQHSPLYNLVKGKHLLFSGQFKEAAKLFEDAKERIEESSEEYNLSQFVSILIELSTAYLRMNRDEDALKALHKARTISKGSPDMYRVMLAEADVAKNRNEIEHALALFSQIPVDCFFHTRAQIARADIYLHMRRNRRAYAQCYLDIAQRHKSVHAWVLLGEAYMKIQEPNKAIQAYESALKINSQDSTLSSRIGKALITTHDYERAVAYYESATNADPDNAAMSHELAELYVQLGMFENAQRLLTGMIKHSSGHESKDVAHLIAEVRSYLLLAKVRQSFQAADLLHHDLEEAYKLQQQVLSLLRTQDPDQLRKQRDVATTIAYNLAQFFQINDMNKDAISYFTEALKHNDAHVKSLLALAKLSLNSGDADLESAHHHCVTLLRVDPANEEAAMMLADIMFRKDQLESATFHFTQLLERHPTHYVALENLILLLLHAGHLKDAPRFLKLAERAPGSSSDAGLHYCLGIYNLYIHNPRKALSELNLARKDPTWGEKALFNMIELYLNPDNEALFSDAAEASGENVHHIASAQRLLNELQEIETDKGEPSIKYLVLKCYAMMATKQKQDLENALVELNSILSADKNNIPALLALATVFMLQKQAVKARNQLRRVAKMSYKQEFADDLERSWLMLADIYISFGKYDLAQGLCQKCLTHNKSCSKAWEHLGLIFEKEHAYKDAAQNYERAWEHQQQQSPSVGFKLAFNYLKARRYVEAIDVCHKVLEIVPDYPRIKKEILEKACASLRP